MMAERDRVIDALLSGKVRLPILHHGLATVLADAVERGEKERPCSDLNVESADAW